MYTTVNIEALSKSQHSRLQNGHGVLVKLSKTGKTNIKATPFQMKKLIRADKNGLAHTISFDPVQQADHKAMRGKGTKGLPHVRLDTRERAMPSMGEQPYDSVPRQSYNYEDEDDMEGEGFRDMVRKFKEKKIGKKIVKVVKKNSKEPPCSKIRTSIG